VIVQLVGASQKAEADGASQKAEADAVQVRNPGVEVTV
jgi:hypothetical protein